MAAIGSPPVEDTPQVIDAQHKHVYGGYIPNTDTRAAGFVAMGVGGVAGVSLIAIGATKTDQQCAGDVCTNNPSSSLLLGAGLGLVVAGGLVGVLLVERPDKTKISLEPFASSQKDSRPVTPNRGQDVWSSREWREPTRSNGLALSFRF
jgi:hypothetical protein